MKYMCWETFSENFLLNGHYRHEAEKIIFRTLDSIWKFAEIMDARDKTHMIHSRYAAGWENISAIFLRVKNTF